MSERKMWLSRDGSQPILVKMLRRLGDKAHVAREGVGKPFVVPLSDLHRTSGEAVQAMIRRQQEASASF